jgi:hypothetical protein
MIDTPIQIAEVTLSKSGRALRVKLGNTWYGAFIDSGLKDKVGTWIVADIEVSDKFGPQIKGWKPVAAPQSAPSASPPSAGTPHSAGAASDNVAPWFWPSVSNICAAAIEKGIITKPEDLNMWALKWAQVCVATKEQVK